MDELPLQMSLGLDATDEKAEELAYWRWEYAKARRRTREVRETGDSEETKNAIHDERMAFLRLGFCELERKIRR